MLNMDIFESKRNTGIENVHNSSHLFQGSNNIIIAAAAAIALPPK